MAKHRKHKVKTITKRVYIKPAEPSVNVSKVKEELKELQDRKIKVREEVEKSKEGKKGFSKFVARFGGLSKQVHLNKEINERRRILGAERKTESARGQIGLIKQRTELEKARTDLREAQKKNAVNFNSGTIKYEDLFK